MSSYWQALARVAVPQPVAGAALRRPALPFAGDDVGDFVEVESEAPPNPLPQVQQSPEPLPTPTQVVPMMAAEPVSQAYPAERTASPIPARTGRAEPGSAPDERNPVPAVRPTDTVATAIPGASLRQVPLAAGSPDAPAQTIATPSGIGGEPRLTAIEAAPIAASPAQSAIEELPTPPPLAPQPPAPGQLNAAALPSVMFTALAEQASARAEADAAEQRENSLAPIVITIDQLEIRLDEARAAPAAPPQRRSAAVVPLDEFLRRPDERR